MDQRRDFSVDVKQARARANWSQDTLAAEAGVDRATIQRIEQNQVKPQTVTIVKVCDVLDIDSRPYLTGESDE